MSSKQEWVRREGSLKKIEETARECQKGGTEWNAGVVYEALAIAREANRVRTPSSAYTFDAAVRIVEAETKIGHNP